MTSWMGSRLVGAREVQRLDLPLMPTATKNLIGALANPSWDPGRRYSMPWQAGLTGIAYDATKVDRAIGSLSELLTRKDLAGRVGLLTFDDSSGPPPAWPRPARPHGRRLEKAPPGSPAAKRSAGPPLLQKPVHQALKAGTSPRASPGRATCCRPS